MYIGINIYTSLQMFPPPLVHFHTCRGFGDFSAGVREKRVGGGGGRGGGWRKKNLCRNEGCFQRQGIFYILKPHIAESSLE
jgi:hypothetical protein